jgi:tight adherence protein C
VTGGLPVGVLLAALAVAVGILALALVVSVVLDPARKASRRNLRAAATVTSDATQLQPSAGLPTTGLGAVLDRTLGRRLPPTLVAAAAVRLDAAGLAGSVSPERIVLLRFAAAGGALLVGLWAAASGSGPAGPLLALLGPVAGFLAPDVFLRMRASSRQEQVLAALPDTLDLMTITVEAGLALESAMVRAGRSGKGPLAEELTRTMQEMQAGVPRIEALRHLAARCDVEDLTSFTSAVAQAERFGVPIARVLRVQSGELREKRRQRAEEAAMKLPTKVILPLALCILPAMMILVVGPSVIQIGRSLSQL